MSRKRENIDLVELFGIVLPFLFIIIIGIYHIKGNPNGKWSTVQVLSENMQSLSMVGLIILLSYSGVIRSIYKYIFAPYFIIKCIYHISCYLQIYIVSPKIWEIIWITILLSSFIVGLIIIRRKMYGGLVKKRMGKNVR